jgi:hypothetical protein
MGRILTIGCHSEQSEESVMDSSVVPLPQNDRGRRAQNDRE